MTQEMENKWENTVKQAEDLLYRLERHYTEYSEKSDKQEKSMSAFTKLFSKWLSNTDSASLNPIHDDFIAGTERIVSELVTALNELEKEEPKLCSVIASKAVGCMLKPEKKYEKTTADWFITAAEQMCLPLLPFLSKEDLAYFRDFMLSRSPRRLMLPKQKEIFDKIEALLK